MKEEIEAAALFITQLVSQSSQLANLPEDRLQTFKRHLIRLFEERFHNHWFPDRPQRGQGFRCIRLNGGSRPDPLIQKAALETGLEYCDLRLPVEFTMWVDPREVSCRFGEHEGSYCTVASFEKETDAKAVAGSTLAPLQVVTDNDRSLAVSQQQISPRRTNTSSNRSSRGSPSPVSPPRATIQQQQQQQYRLNCFYPNYDPSHKGWYPVTATSSYSSLSPPPPMALNYHAPKSRFVQQQHPWGLAYVPTVRYLNNWPMGQMVKV
ncbi:maternal B9.10 protein-like [Daphnia pulex]|uniref:maternal B9.10 protein-like n=1 Tax=Daphnia pulex TaxID=6669 RepID=UPI001EE0E4C3|nr:maternal B9.10 protein-like [Daphnia pulex]